MTTIQRKTPLPTSAGCPRHKVSPKLRPAWRNDRQRAQNRDEYWMLAVQVKSPFGAVPTALRKLYVSLVSSSAEVQGLQQLPVWPLALRKVWYWSLGIDNRELASSKTSFNLYWVKAEHSTYLTAPSSLAIRSPSSLLTGCILCLANLSLTAASSRRSTCVPTIRQGTPGQWWWTSGNHFSLTFSNDAGEVTEKQTRKTSVCGYDSGRRRS